MNSTSCVGDVDCEVDNLAETVGSFVQAQEFGNGRRSVSTKPSRRYMRR